MLVDHVIMRQQGKQIFIHTTNWYMKEGNFLVIPVIIKQLQSKIFQNIKSCMMELNIPVTPVNIRQLERNTWIYTSRIYTQKEYFNASCVTTKQHREEA